ncbi:MAG: hypothetical protein ABFS24_07890 [Pseudomonadota bacterium]
MKHPTEYSACPQATRGILQQAIGLALLYSLCLLLTGCSTWQAPAMLDDTPLRERAVTTMASNIRVSAAVLSKEDNLNIFATNINDKGVQSIWVEVANHSPHTLWLLQSGTDPDYFSPLEVAWSLHKPLSRGTNRKIDDYFDSLSMKNLVPPGETRAGFLYTNPHHGTRVLNIDLLGQQAIFPFTLFPPVPGEYGEEQMHELLARIEESRNNDYQDESAFRSALGQLPCCAIDPRTSIAADPLNVIIIGELADIGAALTRRGYRRDPQDNDRIQRLFGRLPDIVVRKSGQGGVPANWMRMWVAPFRYQGRPVILVQSGRPAGGRFIPDNSQKLTLHPDVDETRSLVIQDIFYSGGLAKLGFVEGVHPVTAEQLFNHPKEFSYRSDGSRAVLFVTTRPLSLSDVEILDWAPTLERQAADAIERNLKEKAGIQQAQ